MAAQAVAAEPVDILIAEDDVLTRRTLRSFLEHEGYCCSEAEDGRAAVELARRQSPRCAILDLGMPVLDGFAVARALRSDPRTRGMHIHCLTGRSDQSAVEEASKAGIEAYMTKPLDPIRLLEIVRQHFEQPDVIRISDLSLTEAREQLDVWERGIRRPGGRLPG